VTLRDFELYSSDSPEQRICVYLQFDFIRVLFEVNPSPDRPLQKGDMLVVISTTADIDRLPL
jgi:hypothetical protein